MRTKKQGSKIRREIETALRADAAIAPAYHDDHLCAACGAKFSAHAGRGNPYVADGTCPSGPFPRWPTTIDDEQKAGRVFDERVEKFWRASGSTFRPKR